MSQTVAQAVCEIILLKRCRQLLTLPASFFRLPIKLSFQMERFPFKNDTISTTRPLLTLDASAANAT